MKVRASFIAALDLSTRTQKTVTKLQRKAFDALKRQLQVAKGPFVALSVRALEEYAGLTQVEREAVAQRFNRRRSDKILLAFEQACVSRHDGFASDLLGLLEQEIYRENTYPGRQRRNPSEVLATAQAKLSSLKAMLAEPGSRACFEAIISDELFAAIDGLRDPPAPHPRGG